jgi:hypothetical protein
VHRPKLCTCWTHGVSFQVLHVPPTVIMLFQCGLMPSNEGFQVEGLSESTRCGGPGGACTCWTHGVSFQVLHVPPTVIILFQCGLMPSNEGFQVEGLSESTRCGGPGGACTCWTHGASFQVLRVPPTVIILFQCGLMPSNEGFQVEGLSESTRCGGPPQRSKRAHIRPAGLFSRG